MTYGNIYRKTFGVVLTLLVSLLFSSCTKEDLSGCQKEENISITFSYIDNNSEDDFPDDLAKMNIYVFDEDGFFFEEQKVENITNKQSGTVHLDLPVGRYTIVSWGNLSSDYKLSPLVKGVSKLSDTKLSLTQTEDKVTKRLSSLYYGSETEIEVVTAGNIEREIQLMNNANVLHITVKGLLEDEGMKPEDVLLQHPVHIEDINGDYKFDNSLASNTPLIYVPSYQIEKKDIVVETVVLRMFEKGNTTLVIGNDKTRGSNELRYNLVELILMSDDIKDQAALDACNYYDIEIVIDGTTHTTSTIKINGWVIYITGGDL